MLFCVISTLQRHCVWCLCIKRLLTYLLLLSVYVLIPGIWMDCSNVE